MSFERGLLKTQEKPSAVKGDSGDSPSFQIQLSPLEVLQKISKLFVRKEIISYFITKPDKENSSLLAFRITRKKIHMVLQKAGQKKEIVYEFEHGKCFSNNKEIPQELK